MREHMLGHTSSNGLRYQASQSGLTPSRIVNNVRAAPMMVPEPTTSNMELAKTARTVRNMTVRNSPPQGCSEGKRSELNDPVLFRGHIKTYFAYADSGAY